MNVIITYHTRILIKKKVKVNTATLVVMGSKQLREWEGRLLGESPMCTCESCRYVAMKYLTAYSKVMGKVKKSKNISKDRKTMAS